jgi:Xylanase inhibitor N-terminal
MVSSIVIPKATYLKRTVLLVYLASAAGIVRGALDNEAESTAPQDANHLLPPRKILSFPLLPHAVVQRRRLEEGRSPLPSRIERPRHSKYNNASSNVDHIRRVQSDYSESEQVAGLFQGYGTHYVDLWCGSPPQRQTVIVDTGSSVTAFACSECQDCGVPDYHIDALYDETKSTTFEKLSCSECLEGSCGFSSECLIDVSYQEGSSWSAYEASDTCYVGGFHDRPLQKDNGTTTLDNIDPLYAPSLAFDMKFGCQTAITGLFQTQLEDGIMGTKTRVSSCPKCLYGTDAHIFTHFL